MIDSCSAFTISAKNDRLAFESTVPTRNGESSASENPDKQNDRRTQMMEALAQQNSLLEVIVKDYGPTIKGAVYKATGGHPASGDLLSEIYFFVLLALRKLGTGWKPPSCLSFSRS